MMFLGSFLSSLFSCFAILTSFMVILTKNPVYSIFFLILSFFNVTSLLFTLQVEFLPISFIVIYVGAIAVLFLFVVMMLNIKLAELNVTQFQYLPALIIFAIIFVTNALLLIRLDFIPINVLAISDLYFLSDLLVLSSLSNFSFWYQFHNNLKTLGFLLLTDFFYHFIVVGYVLLLSMIGVVILTLHRSFKVKTQNIYSQVMRNFQTAIVDYS